MWHEELDGRIQGVKVKMGMGEGDGKRVEIEGELTKIKDV